MRIKSALVPLIFGFLKPRPILFVDEPGDDIDIDMKSFMNENFPVDEKPPEAPPPEAPPKDEEPPEDPPPESKKPDNLPPGFDLDKKDEKPPEDKKDDEKEITLEDIDSAIATETNENKKLNMSRMRTKLEAQSTELQKVTEILNQLREANVIDAENKVVATADPEIAKQLEAAHDEIGRLNIQRDPRFQAQFDKPLNIAIEQIANIVNPNPENDEEALKVKQMIWRVAQMPPTERAAQIREHIPDDMQMAVQVEFREFDKGVRARSEAIQNHQAEQAKLDQQATIEHQNRVEEYRAAVKNTVTSELAKEGFLSHQAGNDEYNKFIDAIQKQTDEVFQSDDPATQARAMALGAQAPVYRGMYEATLAKLTEVQEELALYKKTNVRVNTSKTQDNGGNYNLETNSGIAEMLAQKIA